MILNFIDLSIFHKLFTALNDEHGFVDIMDCLEELCPLIHQFSLLNEFDLNGVSIDDTTLEAARNARGKATELYEFASQLVAEYMELSKGEWQNLVKLAEEFALQIAIIYYGAAGYSNVMEELLSEGTISSRHPLALLDKLSSRKADVEKEVVLIMRLFEKYKPFLAEYVLTEDQLGAIESTLTEGVNFALLDMKTVRSVLGDE